MTTLHTDTPSASYPVAIDSNAPRRLASWSAIFAGWVAAFALQILFLMFGAGVGFAIYSPLTDANPGADFSAGAAVIQGLSAIFSLWFGGWVAGRLTPLGTRATGGLHGFLVWCVATIAGVLVVGTGAGWAAGDLSKLVGGGLSAAGKPVAAATNNIADVAKDGVSRSKTELTSFTDEALGSPAKGGDRAAGIRAKREISAAVTKLFNPSEANNMEENKAHAVKVLQANTNMSSGEATRTVDEWVNSYNELKADLEKAKQEAAAKARIAADEAARQLTILSFASFIAFAIGALAASMGGKHGAQYAIRRPAHVVVV
jgi:hypothetical protein